MSHPAVTAHPVSQRSGPRSVESTCRSRWTVPLRDALAGLPDRHLVLELRPQIAVPAGVRRVIRGGADVA